MLRVIYVSDDYHYAMAFVLTSTEGVSPASAIPIMLLHYPVKYSAVNKQVIEFTRP